MPIATSHKLIIIALAASSAQEIPTGRCNTTDGDAALAFYDVACQLYAVCRNQIHVWPAGPVVCGAYNESTSFGLDRVNCSRYEAATGGNDAADISDKNELVIGDAIIRTELTLKLEHHEDERIRNNPMLQKLGPNLQDSLDAALQGGFPWESGEVAYLLHEALPKMLKYAEDNVEHLLSDEKQYRADLYAIFATEVDAFVEASVLPPAGDEWGAGAKRWAYLRAMNYGFMGQWLPMWTEKGLALNKKSQEWMMQAFEVDPRWTMRKVEMPFEHDGVRVPLNGYFISPRDETEAAARPLTLSSAGGLDWTSAGMVPWVMPLVEEGFNVLICVEINQCVLIYEGPGQGDTLRVHNYAFIPQWDRVMKAVYEYAASSDLPWDRSRGVGHGTASFAGQLGLQACLVAGDEVGVTACYMSPTTASDSRVLGGLVWDGTMDVTRAANYLKDDHPEVFRELGTVPAQYAGYSSDGQIYGADPLVAGLLTCGATGHDALTYPDDWPFQARANAPMSFLGGDELLSLHGDYWLYALAASEIKRKGWTIAEVMLDADKKLAMANYAGLRLLTEFKMEEEEVREPRATRNILLMGSTDDSMFSFELVHHIYDALPEASRAAATVNVYDEQMGGALHCREGAITKSQYTVVAPFLAAALGEASTDAPTPGSDGAAGRSHAVLLWTAVFLLLL